MKTGIAGIMQQSANNRNEAEMAAANERARQYAAANSTPQYSAAMPATSMPAIQAEPVLTTPLAMNQSETTAAMANMTVT